MARLSVRNLASSSAEQQIVPIVARGLQSELSAFASPALALGNIEVRHSGIY